MPGRRGRGRRSGVTRLTSSQPVGSGGLQASSQPVGSVDVLASSQPAMSGGVQASSQPVGSGGSRASSQPDFPCSACSRPVLDDRVGGIQCDRCLRWCHALTACIGFPQKFVRSYLSLDSVAKSGFAFLCLDCRGASAPSASVDSSGEVRELRQSVASLAASVGSLVRDIAALRLDHRNELAALREEIRGLRSDRPQPAVGPGDVGGPAIRDSIREEIRELHERDKRRSSIVVRGLNHGANFVNSFNEVVSSIWPDVTPLP